MERFFEINLLRFGYDRGVQKYEIRLIRITGIHCYRHYQSNVEEVSTIKLITLFKRGLLMMILFILRPAMKRVLR